MSKRQRIAACNPVSLFLSLRGMSTQTQISDYVKKHNVFGMFDELLQQLVIHQPADPIDFLVKYLQVTQGPKLILTSRPNTDVSREIQFLTSTFGVKVIRLSEGLGDLQAVEQLKSKALNEQERGWILINFPKNRRQALALQAAGILPDKLIVIDLHNALEEEKSLTRVANQCSMSNQSSELSVTLQEFDEWQCCLRKKRKYTGITEI
ncbi:hypothetical protein PROFUN_03658 [Planoprotostelium fungivorum]|uniref:Uncharacterized protein n=1 Tax=Planoprotostelium fungivorum TaxID=1890364 RepID=A0A2P6NSL0_9EUKA|nr:hypothetical protein PROFUN_03658 [Planoprotostelium fungivorum]